MALQPDLTCGEGGSTGAVILDRINEHEAEIGDLALLNTVEKSNLTGAVSEVNSRSTTNGTSIGTLSTLTTDAKDTTVNAINEVDSHADANTNSIGTLPSLTTDAKDTLVNAVNEVDAHANTNAADIATLQTQLGLPTKGSMRLAVPLVQTIGNVFETMECFTAVSSERGDVDVTVGTVGSIEYTGAAPAEGEFHYGFNAEFASNEEIEVIPYVNGIAYSSNPMVLRGLGAGKPVSFFWISQVTIQPDDVITLMARSSITNDLDITFDRSVFALKIDG